MENKDQVQEPQTTGGQLSESPATGNSPEGQPGNSTAPSNENDGDNGDASGTQDATPAKKEKVKKDKVEKEKTFDDVAAEFAAKIKSEGEKKIATLGDDKEAIVAVQDHFEEALRYLGHIKTFVSGALDIAPAPTTQKAE
jgi:hypothetical protein